MKERIKVGVIGSGSIAHIAHLPSLASMPEVELTAILSGHYENAVCAAEQFGVKKAVQDFDEFLKQDLDCAFLLTPKNVRKEYLVQLIQAGLHIFCEKPLAMTLRDCEYYAEASSKAGKILMVGFNRRFAPAYQKGLAAFGDQGPEYVLAEKCKNRLSYRATLENAIHMVDLIRYFCGECVKVEAQARFKDPFYEYLCTAMLSFENGSVGLMGASRSAGQWIERVEMYGGDKSVIIDSPEGYRIIYPDHEYHQNFLPLSKGWSNIQDELGFRPCVQHFINCVRTGAKPLTSAEDAIKTHRLLDEILRKAGLPDLSQEWNEN